MSRNDIAIRVDNLSKCYQIYATPRDRLKQFMLPRLQRLAGISPKGYFREFWALRDVSFELARGESVGIIGRNGSGKSTLLQLICGTLHPTSGFIQTHGRVAALLELGSGFNPEFTGRENVFLNAAVLGLSQDEIEARFDSIAAFADIGQFMDQPVKTYSSGMVVRLAFAVQSQIDPDILVVDEALSVGDARFQVKCFERLRHLKENGTSVLLVSHSSEQIVTHCSAAILLDSGIQLETGEPKYVVNRYLDILFGRDRSKIHSLLDQQSHLPSAITMTNAYTLGSGVDCFARHQSYNPHEYRWGDGGATIWDFYLEADGEPYPHSVSSGQRINLVVSIGFHNDYFRPILGITIKTKEGVTVYGVNSETLECDEFENLGRGGSVIQVEATFACRLAPGDYFISLGIASRHGDEIVPHDRRYDSIHLQVLPDRRFVGIADLDLEMIATEIAA